MAGVTIWRAVGSVLCAEVNEPALCMGTKIKEMVLGKGQ